MKDKILQALKTKYANKGFSAKTLESVADYLSATVTEETQIETAVSGVEPIMSVFQSETDSRVNAAVAKAKETQTPPAGAQPGNDTPPKQPDNSDVPAWAKSLIDANQALQQSLAKLQGDQVSKTRSQTLAEKLKDAPEPFKNKILKDFSRMKFETDEDFNAYLEETETDVKEVIQSTADAGLGLFPKPNANAQVSNPKQSEAEIKEWAGRKVEASKQS